MADNTTTTTKPFKIGFLGAATICRKNSIAISDPESTCLWNGIASRSMDKAKQFVEARQEDGSCTNKDLIIMGGDSAYDSLITSDGICNAIYVPLPTALHKEWVLKALRAKKHVLIEKPVALSAADYLEMLNTAKEAHKYLLDGTMFVHSPRMAKLLEIISDESAFGKIRKIESEFTFLGTSEFWNGNIRIRKDSDPFGCIGDLGWYCSRFAQLVFAKAGKKATSAQVTHVKMNDEGVPLDAICVVNFDDLVLSFHCSFYKEITNVATVYGDKRKAFVHRFVLPPDDPKIYIEVSDVDSDNAVVEKVETINEPRQQVLMWKNFARVSRGIDAAAKGTEVMGWGDSDLSSEGDYLASVTLENQMILDALMESAKTCGKSVPVLYPDNVNK